MNPQNFNHLACFTFSKNRTPYPELYIILFYPRSKRNKIYSTSLSITKSSWELNEHLSSIVTLHLAWQSLTATPCGAGRWISGALSAVWKVVWQPGRMQCKMPLCCSWKMNLNDLHAGCESDLWKQCLVWSSNNRWLLMKLFRWVEHDVYVLLSISIHMYPCKCKCIHTCLEWWRIPYICSSG